MSEEEKEAIEQLKSWREYIIKHKDSVNKANDIEFYLRTALNLIDKQHKEIDRLQEENNELKEQLTYAVNTNNKDILENWRKK